KDMKGWPVCPSTARVRCRRKPPVKPFRLHPANWDCRFRPEIAGRELNAWIVRPGTDPGLNSFMLRCQPGKGVQIALDVIIEPPAERQHWRVYMRGLLADTEPLPKLIVGWMIERILPGRQNDIRSRHVRRAQGQVIDIASEQRPKPRARRQILRKPQQPLSH